MAHLLSSGGSLPTPDDSRPSSTSVTQKVKRPINAPGWTVELAISELDIPIPIAPPTSPLPFFHILTLLKTTKRMGWLRFSVPEPESISDHMYRMSILTMLAPASLRQRLNIPRCTKMALVHDMAESLVGDITPGDNVPKEEKSRRERNTMVYIAEKLLGGFDDGRQGKELLEAWDEYEDKMTEESKFVHDIDKIELLVQMVDYEKANDGVPDLSEFTWVADSIVSKEMSEWRDQIMAERAKVWAALGKTPKLFWPDH